MEKVIIGNAYITRITIKKNPSEGDSVLNSPENGVKITVTDPNGIKVVDSQSMTNSSTGKYYYIYQTTTANTLGIYKCDVIVDGATYDAEYISNRLFELVTNND